VTEGPPAPPPHPGVFPPGVRPPGVTAAAVLLFVIGGLGALYSVFGLSQLGTVSAAVSGFEGAGAFLGVFAGVLIVLLALAVLQLLAGGWALARRDRGRAVGLGASWSNATVWLIVLLLGVANGTVDAVGLAMGLLAIGGGITVVVLLIRNSAVFDR
jgi:hypothetical protein